MPQSLENYLNSLLPKGQSARKEGVITQIRVSYPEDQIVMEIYGDDPTELFVIEVHKNSCHPVLPEVVTVDSSDSSDESTGESDDSGESSEEPEEEGATE